MKKILFILVLIILTFGCSSVEPEIKEYQGFYIGGENQQFRFSNSADSQWVEVVDRGLTLEPAYRSLGIKKGEEVHIRVEGKYHEGKIINGDKSPVLEVYNVKDITPLVN